MEPRKLVKANFDTGAAPTEKERPREEPGDADPMRSIARKGSFVYVKTAVMASK